ncbi:phosphatase PAP2 family protein [Marininema halotolerans]|uniref:phosphatase PAP2 family protein n=1 Tax=Marininema halotolerans TaxID=1155944 RepID=UPI001595ADB6|nr:phosphatase PAP2 family protein [Marininema halotolerans]
MNIRNKKNGPWLLIVFYILTLSLTVIGMNRFLKVAEEVQEREAWGIDKIWIDEAKQIASPELTAMMKDITELGSVPWLLTGTVLIIGFFFIRRQFRFAMLFAMGMLGTSVVNTVLKDVYERTRPTPSLIEVQGYSFPSGHTMGALSFFGLILYVTMKSTLSYRIKAMVAGTCLLLILLIGWSRIYLGAHYLTDVVAGYVAGTMILIHCIVINEMDGYLQRIATRG